MGKFATLPGPEKGTHQEEQAAEDGLLPLWKRPEGQQRPPKATLQKHAFE